MFEWNYVVDAEDGRHLTGIINGEDIINAAINLCKKVDCHAVEITSLIYKQGE